MPWGGGYMFFLLLQIHYRKSSKGKSDHLNYLFLKIKERHLAVGAARREVQEELVTHLVREIFVRGKIEANCIFPRWEGNFGPIWLSNQLENEFHRKLQIPHLTKTL